MGDLCPAALGEQQGRAEEGYAPAWRRSKGGSREKLPG